MIALLVISGVLVWKLLVPTFKYYAALVQTLLHFLGLPPPDAA
jgi:hypothetical protein